MKKILIYLSLLTILIPALKADEGMWLLPLIQELNIDRMHEMGLQLTAEDIYHVNHSSLKDAVGALDYGSCTAELISPDGLLLTNHHCGYSEIQSHSSMEHDYLSGGFWALTRDEELPNPGKTVSFLVRMEDITGRIDTGINSEMNESERTAKIEEVAHEIVEQATEGTHYEGLVVPFYEGNKYYLILLETFKDIRLVGTPPESIGKFGHDTDNWMWPRHTGDFCLFRVYTGPDGKPAEYSNENIPYHPKHYLPISLNGVEKGDFAMVLGYPGGTYRYMTSFEIEERMNVQNVIRKKIGTTALTLMMEDMMSSDKVRIQYADKYSSYSNYWKFAIGENRSLKSLDIISGKQQLEQEFTQWVKEDTGRIRKYGEILGLIQEAVKNRREYAVPKFYLEEIFLLYKPIEFIDFALTSVPLFLALLEGPEYNENKEQIIGDIWKESIHFFKNYNPYTDIKISSALLKHLSEDVSPVFHPGFMFEINNKFKGDNEKYLDHVFKKSIFVDEGKFSHFLEKPSIKILLKDPAFIAAVSVNNKYFEIVDLYNESAAMYNKSKRLFLEGLMEMQGNITFYPDANSTLRLTYGTVADYDPRDAVSYDYYTTLAGVMEKENPDNREFVVDNKLKQLYVQKNYGRYGIDGTMPVCFITNNDTSGGNSGSPVVNEKGELIGIVFDGNWESMSGDISFDPELQRCINVDIRYVLFIIDKFAGASHLIQEMKIME